MIFKYPKILCGHMQKTMNVFVNLSNNLKAFKKERKNIYDLMIRKICKKNFQ